MKFPFLQIQALSEQKETRLNDALKKVQDDADLLDQVMEFLEEAERKLAQQEIEPIPEDMAEVEKLLEEHNVSYHGNWEAIFIFLFSLWSIYVELFEMFFKCNLMQPWIWTQIWLVKGFVESISLWIDPTLLQYSLVTESMAL